jgi:hypothetical protein
MTKRENLADPNSCLNKAEDDEPLFILRASDPLAPALVRLWASRHDRGVQEGTLLNTLEDAGKSGSAMAVAAKMEGWRRTNRGQGLARRKS